MEGIQTTQQDTKQPIKTLFDNADIKKRFNEMLGKKAPGFIVSVINTITNNKDLASADRNSILFAAATAATLDLPINPNLGFAYIVAYNGKEGEPPKAQFQLGYKGFIQLAQRSGLFETISAAPIYEGQLVEENPLTGFKFDFTKRTSDKVKGYAAYFKLLNGFNKTLYMTVEDLKKHGLKYSQSYKSPKKWIKDKSLWTTDFDSMAMKTVIKLLLSKFAPLSIDMQKAIIVDQSVIKDWNAEEIEAAQYVDNAEIRPDLGEVQKAEETERIIGFIKKSTNLDTLRQYEPYTLNNNLVKDSYDEKLAEFQVNILN